ncbi:MAG: response regulator [Campylobacterales bacterium]
MRTVLIADDEPFSRQMMAKICAKLPDVSVLEAKDGAEACELILSHHPDLVICDIVMPHLSGFDVARFCDALVPETFVVALTAYDTPSMRQRTAEAGFDHYLVKPIEPLEFAKQVETLFQMAATKFHKHHDLGVRKARNLFSQEILPIRSEAVASTPDEMMMIGGWIMEYCRDDSITREAIDFIYTYSRALFETDKKLNILFEFDIEHLYITIELKKKAFRAVKDFFKSESFQKIAKTNKSHLSLVLFKHKRSDEDHHHTPTQPGSTSFHPRRQRLSATEFLASIPHPITDELNDIKEAEQAFKRQLQRTTSGIPRDFFAHLSSLFGCYATFIGQFGEMAALGNIFAYIAQLFGRIHPTDLDVIRVSKISKLLETLHNDLVTWRETIFITQEAQDIHYLDDSLISSMIMLERILLNKTQESAGDTELF